MNTTLQPGQYTWSNGFAQMGMPVILSPYVPRGSVLKTAPTGWGAGTMTIVGAVFMHPLDFHEMGYEKDAVGRLKAGVAYLTSEALRRLDVLSKRLDNA